MTVEASTGPKFRALYGDTSSTLNQRAFRFLDVAQPLKERVAEILKDQGINQTQLADAAGVTKGWVSQWMDGQGKSMDYDAAVALHRKFKYAVRWLIKGEGPKMASAEEVAKTLGEAAVGISDVGLEIGRAYDQLSVDCQDHVRRQIELLRLADVGNGRLAAQHDAEIKGGKLQTAGNRKSKKRVM
jgi:transcriptional regulator with XRE-family HTH domain